MTTGERIKQARLANEWSQLTLSIEADVSQSTISIYEHEKRAMSLPVLRRIAKALGLTLQELTGDA